MTAPPPSSPPRFRELVAGRTPLLVALGAIVVGLCLLVVFAALLLRGGDVLEGDEPTAFPTSPGSAVAPEVIVGGIVSGTPISLSVNAPTTLEIGAQTYGVRPEPVGADGSWDPELSDEQTAAWLYGTLINYVVGLADSGNNRDLLEGLAAGANVYLVLRDGTRYGFAITGREFVPTNRVDLFAQNFPGLTLLLVGGRGDERLVVRGDYVVDTTAGSAPGAGNQIELGQTAQLDNLRLSVTGATSLFDRPEAPPGFIFYLVDMQLDNAGTEVIDLAQLQFALRDDLGNQYALNPQGSSLGTNPAPGGTLGPGESRAVSLAYQLPRGLTSPTVTLLISRQGGTGQVLVTLPFAGGGAEAAQTGAVTLQQAEVSDDGTTLNLFGQISNSGTQPLIVSEDDVSLMADGTVHLILATNPAFPWTVGPGETIPYTLAFQRPATAEAIFTLLRHPFQLTGLR